MKNHQRKTFPKHQQELRRTMIPRCVAVASLIATFATVGAAQVQVPRGLTPAGVFSAQPTEGAFTTVATPRGRFIESGAGFLWYGEDRSGGPAVGFNQLLAVPENESREDYDFAAFFAQNGIGIIDPLDDGFTMEFTRWATDPPTEEKPEETVLVFAKLFDLESEQVDINNDGLLNVDDEVSLSGVPFSATPLGRDTIPAFTFDLLAADDPTVDHIEFVNTAWDEPLVDRVTSFLQATDLIDSAQAGQISSQFVPEPTAASMAVFGVLGLLGFRRRD